MITYNKENIIYYLKDVRLLGNYSHVDEETE